MDLSSIEAFVSENESKNLTFLLFLMIMFVFILSVINKFINVKIKMNFHKS